MSAAALVEAFGEIDIYLFDQLLKGRFPPGSGILDAGCGGGRNLVYFLRQGYPVSGLDASASAIAQVRQLAGRLAPALPASNFRAEPLEESSFPDHSFDAVLASAVLHFARSDAHFERMLQGAWRLLRPGGFFFARLASSIGIEGRVVATADGRYRLPDGSERYLVDEARLLALGTRLAGTLCEPIKTTNVQGLRAMTTWCLEKQ
jgi:SAM-dependent methyltransferase